MSGRAAPEMRFLNILRPQKLRRAGEPSQQENSFCLHVVRGERVLAVPVDAADLAKIVAQAGEALGTLIREGEGR